MITLNKFARTTLIAAPVALMGGAVLAGGLAEPVVVVEPAPVAPVVVSNDWTGPYVGAQLGWGEVDLAEAPDDFEFDGAIYGVHAGYLFDLGSFVAGAELDYDLTNIESDVIGIVGDGDLRAEVDSIARAKAILGFDAGSVMPYVTLGIVRADLSFVIDDETIEEIDDTGRFAGIGVSYMATDNLRVGAEVLQHEFEDFDDSEGFDFDVTTATIRASFSF